MGQNSMTELVEHYEGIVEYIKGLGYTSEEDLSNLKGTPKRAAVSLLQTIKPKSEIQDIVRSCISKTFDSRKPHGGMVTSINTVTFSLCPHHLLPVIYRTSIGYIPSDSAAKVIGISKMPRIARAVASAPILQESLTEMIADIFFSGFDSQEEYNLAKEEALEDAEELSEEEVEWWGLPHLHTLGAGCVTVGLHMCVACRGVGSWESRFVYAAQRGLFLSSQNTKNEFLNYVMKSKQPLL